MNSFKANWHFMRIFRLALALFSIWQALDTDRWFFWLFAAFFLIQAVFNLGCTPNGCNLPNQKRQS
ncbi:hypothetical protein LZZ90_12040 [Flavobacterium sp. SM15]|uniref:hypothetical protein n=1 Tax=Flavobacterium sp. SM15 TaxID=2908005 RepID=UPI001EDC0DCF|nr:hypothetical protein [Flavobacterium sp. SM15]MCG2612236.1 hypothetical protein [Flavobacterium sp. SM15]